MTKSQQTKIEMVKKDFCKSWMFDESYEIKKEEIEDHSDLGICFYYLETGLKNDEGTYAAIFGRNSIHIQIGVKGGMKDLRTGKHIQYVYQAKVGN